MNSAATLSDRRVVSRGFMEPLWLTMGTLVVAGALLWFSIGAVQRAKAVSIRNLQNVTRAKQSALDLARSMPPVVEPEGTKTSTQRITDLVDHCLHGAAVGDRALRSQSIHSLGSVGQTAVSREQERIELSGLTLTQAGMIVDTLERAPLPIWVESAAITPVGPKAWSLVLEIDWLETTAR